MQIENDYDKDVYNGDLGVVSRIDMGHARQAGGDSTLKLRRHGYGGLGAKSSAAVHCK
jgi:ATP-dependent exoDNAse (exonuclease V) alpha subunit